LQTRIRLQRSCQRRQSPGQRLGEHDPRAYTQACSGVWKQESADETALAGKSADLTLSVNVVHDEHGAQTRYLDSAAGNGRALRQRALAAPTVNADAPFAMGDDDVVAKARNGRVETELLFRVVLFG